MLKRTIYAVYVVLGYLNFVHKADCQPSFTVIPNNGNPIYVSDGASSLPLTWDYNADGRTVERVYLVYTNGGREIVLARKAPGQPLEINSLSGYDGRVTFTGRATFTISSIVPSDSGTYQCRVTFTTVSPPEIPGSNVEVVVVDKSEIVQLLTSETTVCRGTNIAFHCSAYGNPSVSTYQLYKNEVPLNDGSSSGMWKRTMSTGGVFKYKCVVNNNIRNETSPSIAITVNVPSTIQPIQNETLTEGGDVTLFCNASGMPLPSVSWIKVGGGELTNRKKLVFTNINRNEAGEYRCEASNLCGNDSKSATVDVQFFSTAAPSKPGMVNKDVIYGPVIAVLALMFIFL